MVQVAYIEVIEDMEENLVRKQLEQCWHHGIYLERKSERRHEEMIFSSISELRDTADGDLLSESDWTEIDTAKKGYNWYHLFIYRI